MGMASYVHNIVLSQNSQHMCELYFKNKQCEQLGF